MNVFLLRLRQDGILCSIVSLLPVREAVRTCVLSRRWKNIWTHLTKLQFDADNTFDATTLSSSHEDEFLTDDERDEIQKERTNHFILSVDSVLQQRNHCARIEELTIEFYLNKHQSSNLDAWIRSIVASKTKRINLDLTPDFSYFVKFGIEPEPEQYVFPFHLLGSSYVEELSLMSCSLKLPCEFVGFSHLKILRLDTVYITDEDMKCVLSNCANLEYLTVLSSRQLVALSIPPTMSRLRFLYVDSCSGLRRIEIGAINISFLLYHGNLVDFILKQSPALIDADVRLKGERITHNLEFYLTKLTSNFPCLRSLSLNIGNALEVGDLPRGSCSFTHLTSFNWTWSIRSKMSLQCLAALLAAAPFLEEFKMTFKKRIEENSPTRLGKLKKMLPKQSHTYLKRVQIIKFYPDKWQFEIILYLLNNATELDLMTINKGFRVPIKYIKNLSRHVPANVKLVIL